MTSSEQSAGREYGRIVPPYPVSLCVVAECRRELDEVLGAYLHMDRSTGKLIVLCGGCSVQAQMNHSLQFPLVML